MKGKVYLVGAGPGDPELLTLKALRVLKTADIVLHDDLVTREILALVPPTTRLYNVGKRCGRKKISQREINALMVTYASDGWTVVRLKGGDPLIFGRAGEEMSVLREAGVKFEVVPGVTAALGAAAAAQISLTDRWQASKLIFLTAHRRDGENKTDWHAAASPEATVVVYMPGHDYSRISARLSDAGLHDQTPCLIVSCATTPLEQVHRTTLRELSDAAPLPTPTLLVIGTVAAAGWDREGDSESDSVSLATATAKSQD